MQKNPKTRFIRDGVAPVLMLGADVGNSETVSDGGASFTLAGSLHDPHRAINQSSFKRRRHLSKHPEHDQQHTMNLHHL